MSVPAAYLGVVLIWSTTPLAVQWSGAEAGILFSASTRALIGATLCLGLLWWLRQPLPWHRRALQTYAASAMMIYLGMSLVFWGAQFIPSGLIAVLFGLGPFITSILAALLLGERALTFFKLLGIMFGLTGLGLIFQGEFSPGAAVGHALPAILGAVLLHSLSGVLIKRLDANLPPLSVATGGLCLSAPLYLLTWWAGGASLPETWSFRGIGSIVYLGTLGSSLGFIFYYYILKHLETHRVALITLITPILALLWGRVLNGEQPGIMLWWGSAAVLAGLMLHLWDDRCGSKPGAESGQGRESLLR